MPQITKLEDLGKLANEVTDAGLTPEHAAEAWKAAATKQAIRANKMRDRLSDAREALRRAMSEVDQALREDERDGRLE
jgi:hypothetical protein